MKNSIRRLRIIALLLFITPAIALVGSLFLNNYLATFKFTHEFNYNFTKNLPGNSISIHCSDENKYCSEINFEKFTSLNQCYTNIIILNYSDEDGNIIEINNNEIIKNFEKKIFINYILSDQKDPDCITNSKSIRLYNILPIFYESIYQLKINEKTSLGTSYPVNPFFYGETSISNIVKRFPLNFFFKPLLYLSVIFMLFYWIYYNKVIKNLINSSKNYYFFYFGILSAIFLLLHVFFLGWSFENEFLSKLRRTFVVFFILFEVLAQAFLIKKIFSIKDQISNYLNSIIVYSKLLFVFIICFTTILILLILIFYNLSPEIDYILEWNYFLILLFFYFLSFLMWRKVN